MYRCKECGTEYELKPEYCDCGNDTFEEILPAEPQKTENEVPINKNESEMWVEESGFGYPINEKTYNEFKKETASKNSSAIQPYAIVTFVACIILSLLIILFAFNPKNFDDKKTEIGKKDTTSQNLPTIENIWNNSLGEARIFSGWDKTTAHITANTDVYATWITGNLPSAATLAERGGLNGLNVAELYALSRTSPTNRAAILTVNNDPGAYIKDHIDITLGNDFNFSNIES